MTEPVSRTEPVTAELPVHGSVVELTRALCDIPSVSGDERGIADAVERALSIHAPHLHLMRDGDAIIARTQLGRTQRIVIAGHLDTVPINNNVPTRLEPGSPTSGDPTTGDPATGTPASGTPAFGNPAPDKPSNPETGTLWGRGTVDMKGGCAVMLALAVQLTEPVYDVTWVWYDHEEVASELNGLGRIARTHPQSLAADFAILAEPSNAVVEGGCNGTVRIELRATGRRAHSARAWMGVNALHALAPALELLARFEPETINVDGLAYREGLSAVGIAGGVAGNVIPDAGVLTVNYRFAPDKTAVQAEQYLRTLFGAAAPELEVVVTDAAQGARPGLDAALAQHFISAVGGTPAPKYGWTDVARFAELGIPAVNYGPGDPSLAHADDERVPVEQILACERGLRAWLTGA